MNKVELRRQCRTLLVSISSEQREAKSRNACRNLIATEAFQNASTVMMFLSLPHEIDTSEAILHAWQQDKVVAVPKVSWEQRHMIAVSIDSLDTGFSTDNMGLRNPTDGAPIPFEEIDLVVTPGLGFDRHGHRLGRGAAFYDRFFANAELTAARCGFAFAEQVMESIPIEASDESVHFLVTDVGLIDCSQ